MIANCVALFFFFFFSKNTLGEYTIVEVEAVQLQTVLDVSGNGI